MHNFGHCTTTNGERASVSVWDDVNRNGRWDEGECSNRYDVTAITSHNMHVTEPLAYLNFDRDRDNLPDWWEMANGLDIDGNPKDEYADPDGDGLINLHEFWAGTNPLRPDGSNTLLSVFTRSIDERLRNHNIATNVVDVYVDYAVNGFATNFIRNSECWLEDVDLSCCSMWNEAENSLSGPTQTAITVISPRHVVYATHYDYAQGNLYTMPTNKVYFFRGVSGTIYSRRIIEKRGVGGDIAIGLLDTALPVADVRVAHILADNYYSYIGTGRLLPTFIIDQQEKRNISKRDFTEYKCRI